MTEIILHQTENNIVSEQHLKDNGKKFSRHCNIVLEMMYRGKRLTARQLEREFNIDGRRLRDIYANRKDCNRQWRVDKDGKTQEMEYYLNIPKRPTKEEVVKNWIEPLNGKKLEQKKLFD